MLETFRPDRPTVIALHCSGAGPGQWRLLGESLGDPFDVLAPEHYGHDRAGPWPGDHAFTLADEAARTLALIDRCAGPVHLVGHSYGGGLALHVAAARSDRIASLALYEPSAFHLLKALGGANDPAFAEIAALARATAAGVSAGDYQRAAATFVDYWGGHGAWAALRPAVQTALVRWILKAPLDFHALIEEPTPSDLYAGLDFPVLLMRGEHAPRPTRRIVDALAGLLPQVATTVVDGAGHMGPLTHASFVSERIAAHIATVEAGGDIRRRRAIAPARADLANMTCV